MSTAYCAPRTFLHPRGLAARFERLRHLAGVPDASLHRFRHTVAVMLVSKGELLNPRNDANVSL